ncbi:MAG: PHP domain-containing protein, partial [Chloroflexota bacterium]|nr:PHP domain-containing protein [Chloroflexota bacterium]
MGLSNEPDNRPDVDWHCHSTWSDGQGTVPGLVKRATARGVRLGISDHALRDNRRLRTPEQLSAYRDLLREHDVLAGVEISVGDLSDGVDLAAFDYVIASLHTVHVPAGVVSAVRYLNWRAGLYASYSPSLAMGEREVYFDAWLRSLEATLQMWPVTVLGHFSLLPDHANARGVYVLGEEAVPDATAAAWLDATIMLCLQYNVAIELNSKSRVPPQSFVERALELGATFSLGSDAHQARRAGD